MSRPTLSYAGLTSALLLTAYAVSAAFQLYRASLGTGLAVDRFGADAAVAYLVFLAVAVAARSGRRLVAYAVAVIVTANLAYGVVGYYPAVHAARPMDLGDWLEGTVFLGLLGTSLLLTVLRLAHVTLTPAPPAPAATASPALPQSLDTGVAAR
jgi:hypothetical protein